VSALVAGLTLPSVSLAPVGAEVGLGRGTTDLVLRRRGDSLDARMSWESSNVTWRREDGAPADTARTPAPPAEVSAQGLAGAARRSAEDVIWRTLAGLRDVRIEARLSGSLSRPRLAVGSNVARALADGLRAELGAELRRAEGEVRDRVDALVQERVASAEQAVQGFQSQVEERVAAERARLEQVKRDLEARVRALAGVPGIGGR
jgi:hypothetical protein